MLLQDPDLIVVVAFRPGGRRRGRRGRLELRLSVGRTGGLDVRRVIGRRRRLGLSESGDREEAERE
jgi:hypothetical protein